MHVETLDSWMNGKLEVSMNEFIVLVNNGTFNLPWKCKNKIKIWIKIQINTEEKLSKQVKSIILHQVMKYCYYLAFLYVEQLLKEIPAPVPVDTLLNQSVYILENQLPANTDARLGLYWHTLPCEGHIQFITALISNIHFILERTTEW